MGIQAQNSRKYIGKESWGGAVVMGSNWRCTPGDTLVVKEGVSANTIHIENVHGSLQKPIVIINEDKGAGTPLTAIAIKNCTHVKVTGSGSKAFYGFISDGSFSAVEIYGRSAYIEVERIKVINAKYIVRAKQDPDCADSLNYPNWKMDHISIHDLWARNINQDGIYIGNTAPVGLRPITCEGKTVYPVPMRMSNVKVYNNYIDSCGRTGIQLGGVDSGFNEVYNNVVRRTGFEYNQTQGSGIIIGGMSHAYVHHNTTRQTYQFGILCHGTQTTRIEFNDIDSAGWLNGAANPGYAFSIACNALTTIPADDSAAIVIVNNKVGNSDAYNIVTGTAAPLWKRKGNIICNNTRRDGKPATIHINGPGFFYQKDCEPDKPKTRVKAKS